MNLQGKGHHNAVDLTPMIDVVFQLIIFFMLSSHLNDLKRSKIDLPEQKGQCEQQSVEAAMIIDIDASGQYLLDSKVANLEEIHRVATAGLSVVHDEAQFDVLIRPDQFVAAEKLDTLLVRLTEAGVSRWKLGTRVPTGGGSD